LSDTLKETPLHGWHTEHKAVMAPFAGWEMPIRYSQISTEHCAVREAIGLFDVSHMGELWLRGEGALALANRLFTNDVSKGLPDEATSIGRALYGAVLNDEGGILDDVIAYPHSPESVLFCVNASNVAKIRQWFAKHVVSPVTLVDESETTGQIAVQGPKAPELLGRLFGSEIQDLRPMRFRSVQFAGAACILATTGYTGERGAEIFVPWDTARSLWEALMETGADLGVQPVGLGARDTLRLEKGFCLYGNELDETRTPLEAGLSWTVKFDKGGFLGDAVLMKQRDEGVRSKLVAISMEERGIPRSGYPILTSAGKGQITSGTFSPLLKQAIAMGYVPSDVEIGDQIQVEIHGKLRCARVAKLPFV